MTLTGPGGVGKTRLALRVAADVQRAFRRRVAGRARRAGEPRAARRIGERGPGDQGRSPRPPVEVLIDHLREKRALLILDNCEHLLEPAPYWRGCCARAPSLRILATSREALGIAGEQALAGPHPAAAAPGAGRPSSPSGPGTVGGGTACSSSGPRRPAGLRAHRGQPARRGADLPAAGRHPAGDRAGGGAAAALSAEQIAAPAGQPVPAAHRRFTRDAAPPADAARAVDWSYALCTGDGAAAVGAALGVRRRPGPRGGRGGLLRGRHRPRGGRRPGDRAGGQVGPDPGGSSPRFHGDPLPAAGDDRQYGRERLVASGQECTLQRLHRDHFRRLAAEAYAQRFGPLQVSWLGQAEARPRQPAHRAGVLLHRTRGDLRRPGHGHRPALPLDHEPLPQGGAPLDGPEPPQRHAGPDEIRGRALWSNSWLAIIQADVVSAATMLEEAGNSGTPGRSRSWPTSRSTRG